MKSKILKTFVIAIILVVIFGSPQVVLANTRTVSDGQVPFYARIEITDGSLVAINFYYPPENIRDDFNLLDFYDDAMPWGTIPTTTEGFMLWADVYDPSAGPILSQLKGKGAVPIWFVSLAEFDTAVADDVLTIGELEAFSSLQQGFANFYQETLRPYPVAVTTTMLIEASGNLVDGQAFKVHMNASPGVYNVKISIGA